MNGRAERLEVARWPEDCEAELRRMFMVDAERRRRQAYMQHLWDKYMPVTVALFSFVSGCLCTMFWAELLK